MKTILFFIVMAGIVGGLFSLIQFVIEKDHANSPTLAHTRQVTGCDPDLAPTLFFDCVFAKFDERISALEAVHGPAQ